MRTFTLSFILLFGFSFFLSFQQGFEKNPNRTIIHVIKNDSIEYELFQVLDTLERPVYYYRDVEAFPCQAKGVCKLIKVRIYWDILGNYLQYELNDGEALTKLNHKDFSDKDYNKLHRILSDTISGLKYCKYETLTASEAENKFHSVDAISGATAQNLDFEYINGAIKTTYSLWKLVNGSTQHEIVSLTNQWLNELKRSQKVENLSLMKNEKLWTVYLNDKNNFTALYKLVHSESQLEDKLLTFISQELSKSDKISFYFLMQVLSNSNAVPKVVAANIAKQLDSNNYYKYVLTYNYFIKKGKRKYLKKRSINYQELNL